MKTKLLLLLFSVLNVSGQVIDVVTNLNSLGVSNLTYKDNYVYFNSYNQKKIYRFDYTISNPSIEIVLNLNENPNFIYVKENYLYVGVESPYKTYKIDLTQVILQPVLLANIAGPMLQIENELFIGQYVAEKITKVNLDTNSVTDVLVGYKPNFFATYNNELYFTSNTTNTLYKYNINTENLSVILSGLNYASGIVINDNYLFMCQSTGNSISYYSQPTFQFENLIQLAPNSWPNGIIIIDNNLFFVQTVAGKISKINLNDNLNVQFITDSVQPKFKVYPNPATSYLIVDKTTYYEEYKILDAKGKLIQSSKLTDKIIDVTSLPNGTYKIFLDNDYQIFLKN